MIVAALRMAEDQFTELFHIYYQPLLVLLGMLWMWGANVRFFEARRVRYGVCFSPHDQAFLLTGRQIHQATNPLLALIICPSDAQRITHNHIPSTKRGNNSTDRLSCHHDHGHRD